MSKRATLLVQVDRHMDNLVGLAIQFDFMRLHYFLDGGANITQPHVDTCFSDACKYT